MYPMSYLMPTKFAVKEASLFFIFASTEKFEEVVIESEGVSARATL
jgi:hypothetical protein